MQFSNILFPRKKYLHILKFVLRTNDTRFAFSEGKEQWNGLAIQPWRIIDIYIEAKQKRPVAIQYANRYKEDQSDFKCKYYDDIIDVGEISLKASIRLSKFSLELFKK